MFLLIMKHYMCLVLQELHCLYVTVVRTVRLFVCDELHTGYSDWLGVAIKLLGLLKGQGCPDRRAVGTYTYVDRLRVCFIWFRYIYGP
eukprot:jgi/Botrbrau1/15099/Bobra.0255s0011.1